MPFNDILLLFSHCSDQNDIFQIMMIRIKGGNVFNFNENNFTVDKKIYNGPKY